MAIATEELESHWRIRLAGQMGLPSAAELRDGLRAWLAAGRDLEWDLEEVEEIDIAILQLLWVAEREARRTGVKVTCRASAAAIAAAREAGFVPMAGFPLSE
jgi:ABC-type transporter Mla MlaB component